MIKLFVSDIDGTLTDGTIQMDSKGRVSKRYSRIDGQGISKLLATGVRVLFLTSSNDKCDRKRFETWEEERFCYLRQNVLYKINFLIRFCKDLEIDIKTEVAYIGDDMNDKECLEMVKYAFFPKDSFLSTKEFLYHSGGKGAVREATESVILINKSWEK